MSKHLSFFIVFLLLTACSSQALSLKDLKETYPQSFGDQINSLSQEKQEKIGLPNELPFDVSSVKASTEDQTVGVNYESESKARALVTTIYEPENILQDSEMQIPLNSGAVAGVIKKEDYVFVEWYESDPNVIYQIKYYGPEEKQTEKAINMANAI